jgi:hypothetical protein
MKAKWYGTNQTRSRDHIQDQVTIHERDTQNISHQEEITWNEIEVRMQIICSVSWVSPKNMKSNRTYCEEMLYLS